MQTTGSPPQNSFTCPICGMTSFNPSDVANEYCGNCHDFTGEQTPRCTGNPLRCILCSLMVQIFAGFPAEQNPGCQSSER